MFYLQSTLIVSWTAYTPTKKWLIFSGNVSGKISGLGVYKEVMDTKRKAEHLENTGIPPMRFFLKKIMLFPKWNPKC